MKVKQLSSNFKNCFKKIHFFRHTLLSQLETDAIIYTARSVGFTLFRQDHGQEASL